MSQRSGLTIRQHEREAIALRAEFVVAPTHGDQVRFTPMSGAAEAHVTRGTATDVSSGGVGLVCSQFVPRMGEGTVRIYDPTPTGTAGDGSPIYEIRFQHAVKVRRVSLASHDPTFAIGVAFIDAPPDIEQRVAELLEMAGVESSERGGADG